MIVVAIIGILAAIAVPAYQDYAVKAKTSEAVIAASAAKGMMSEAFQTDGISGLTAAAVAFNATAQAQKQSKYVSDVQIAAASPWNVTVVISATLANGISTTLNGTTLVFTPNVQNAAPTAASLGAIDWACAGTTSTNATARGLGSIVLGTLPGRYAPWECK